MARWVALDFGPGTGGCLATWVEAEDEEAAGDEALPVLAEMRGAHGGGEPMTNVFVVRADEFVALMVVAGVERAPLQCCGGLPPEWPERHVAGCSEAPDGMRGWPVPEPAS